MGRYPNESVERFDQQFAESEDGRNERIAARRKKKLASPYGEWCRDPDLCAGKGYCPRDPNCGD